MEKLILCILICLPAAAATITSVSGTCVASDGYMQSWAYQISGNANSNMYTCTDPGALNSQGQPMTATFTATASSGISPAAGGQNIVSSEVWEADNQGSIFLGVRWTNLMETVSIQQQETFIATGGSGQAFIEGFYGIPLDDGLIGSTSTSFGGCSGCFTPLEEPFGPIPFTFGQPFTLSMDAIASHPFSIGSINDGKAALEAQISGIFDANGNSIAGVQFTPVVTPEPAGLAGLGMIVLILARRVLGKHTQLRI